MTTRDWQELVSEGRRIESGRNWALGDLALEVQTSYGENTLERFADEIGVSFDSLKQYRFVAARYENGRRLPHLNWSVHQAFAALDDRHDVLASRPVWTVAAARDFVAHRKSVVPELTSLLDKARGTVEEVRRLLADVGVNAAQRHELNQPLRLLVDSLGSLTAQLQCGDIEAELRSMLGGAQ